MQTLKRAVGWLFGTSDGHFALLFTMFISCAIAAAFNVPHAYEAASALVLAVTTKLKN